MSCIYCQGTGNQRPTICAGHVAILDVMHVYGPMWKKPIPLEVYFSQLRVRNVRMGIERVRALLETMEMPYQCWSALSGRKRENDGTPQEND